MHDTFTSILILSISYTLVACVLVIIHMRTSLHWGIKSSLTLGMALFYIMHYYGLKQLPGWPSHEELPSEFRLVAAQIYEPNPITQHPGHIYLWVSSMHDDIGLSTPQAFVLDYNGTLHTNINQALNRMKSGKPQLGTTSENETQRNKQTTRRDMTSVADMKITFEDLPSRLLPEK
ncbi:MAG: hypothetical protein GDA54_00540 [Alphaproteobacteria bacterium GM7ARS4]|nr:hypothetical protein [Alphaproteobacteria bacterium GM7ARS4]